MSLRTFIIGLSASFGVAWLAIVVVPFIKMRNLAPIELNEATDGATGVFYPKRVGRIENGAQVYAENGCYLCHTQLVRPTYAGNDLYRPDWGGLKAHPDRGDTRRETNAFDFAGERFAQIGVSRMGPDLSNVGRRIEANHAPARSPEHWFYEHLYNPRYRPEKWKSTCPSFRFLFTEKKVQGARTLDALAIGGTETTELVPTAEAKALVSYLVSMKKDQQVPASLNFAPAKNQK
jgi:cytochrome c oxidase cbb3-type subunit 2